MQKADNLVTVRNATACLCAELQRTLEACQQVYRAPKSEQQANVYSGMVSHLRQAAEAAAVLYWSADR